MSFASYPKNEIAREWLVGSFSEMVHKKECKIESTEFSNIINEKRLKWKISFQPGLKADATSSNKFLTALVYITTDINTKVQVAMQIQQNDNTPVKMRYASIWLINKRDRSKRGFFFYLKRSKLIDSKKDLLWEISNIRLFCKIREIDQSFQSNTTYDYAIESPLIRPINSVEVNGVEFAESLTTSDKYDTYFFDNRYLSDITFYVDDVLCIAHMAILSRRSRFFKALFSHEIVHSQPHNFVFLVDNTSFEQFYTMLKYIYTKKIENNTLLRLKFLDWPLVKVLSVKGIKIHCTTILRRILNLSNAYFIYKSIARKHGFTELMSFIKKFIDDNIDYFRNDLDNALYYLGSDLYAELGFGTLEEEEAERHKSDKEGAYVRCL